MNLEITLIKEKIAKKIIGKWEPAHDETGHHYRHVKTGKVVDSVSTKLIFDRPHLKRYAVYEALKYMDKTWPNIHEGNRAEHYEAAFQKHLDSRDDAGSVGTKVHKTIERYLQQFISTGIRPENIRKFLDDGELDGRVIAGVRSAEKFFQENDIVPLAYELIVGDKRMNYAGTLDLIALWNNELVLIDHKTSNQIDKIGYPLQVSAYQRLFEKMTKLKITKSVVIHYSKNYDKSEIYDVIDVERNVKAFNELSKFYDWMMSSEDKIAKRKNVANFIKLT